MNYALRRWFASILAFSFVVPLCQACSDAPSHTVEIDFSAAPEVMVGAQVLVDGRIVGRLQPDGSVNVAAFKVAAGDRTVELRKEGYESQVFEFTADSENGRTSLTATVATWLLDGEFKNALILK
jgi:hypothetical protein